MTADQLRVASLPAPHHGGRSSAHPTDVVSAALALAAVLTQGFAFSHLTAARLLGLWVRSSWQAWEPLHVMTCGDGAAVRRPGVVGHRGLERRSVVETPHGLPVVCGPDTWADLAATRSHDDLVILGDSLIANRSGHRLGDLENAVRPGSRGRRRAIAALREIRPGSASAMESLARLVLVRAGLPEPRLNEDVFAPGGGWLARVDLYWPSERVIVEYDGDYHRTLRGQWQKDILRLRLLASAGYQVLVVTADDLGPRREAFVALVRSALTHAGPGSTSLDRAQSGVLGGV
jgi:hypothetical protein